MLAFEPVSSADVASSQPPFEQLRGVVAGMRDIFEELVKQALETGRTDGTCFYGCLLLRSAIGKFTDYQPIIRGGDGQGDGGYWDARGVAQGHYWVEAHRSGEAWVVDITADQFGDDRIIILPLSKSLSRYRPGQQDQVDAHVREHGQGLLAS